MIIKLEQLKNGTYQAKAFDNQSFFLLQHLIGREVVCEFQLNLIIILAKAHGWIVQIESID